MPICPNCGVELASGSKHCPLCRETISSEGDSATSGFAYPDHTLDPENFEDLTGHDKRKIFLEVYSVCSLIACFVVLAVELLMDQRISWSLFPVVSLCYLWLLVCTPFILIRYPWLIFAVLAPASLIFIFLLDLLTQGLSWFFWVGMPIVLLVEGLSLGCIVLTAASKRKGVNVIALVLLGISLLCLGIEAILNLNYAPSFFLSWSAVVATAGIPVAGFLFYLHYRITKRASLKKLFRL